MSLPFRVLAAALLLLLPSFASAQSVKLPAEVRGDPGGWVVIVPESKDGGEVKWKVPSGLQLVPLDKLFPGQKSAGIVVSGPKGRYDVWAWNAKGDVASDLAVCTVVIGDSPIPPVPPGPTPDPKPDPPKPDPPSPAPIPLAGFRVLVVYESSVANSTLAIVSAKPVFDYLMAKCAKDGASAEWRVFDKDVKLDNAKQHWKDAMARPRTTIPWVIISNGVSGYEGPLPKTADETLALLKKYGG